MKLSSDGIPISDSEPWLQCLLYNMGNESFLCWNRHLSYRDGAGKVVSVHDDLIWCDSNWVKRKPLIVLTDENIHQFELRKGNKPDNLTDLGIDMYDFLHNYAGWGKVIFVPLLCRGIVDGTFEGLLDRLNFVHGFMI